MIVTSGNGSQDVGALIDEEWKQSVGNALDAYKTTAKKIEEAIGTLSEKKANLTAELKDSEAQYRILLQKNNVETRAFDKPIVKDRCFKNRCLKERFIGCEFNTDQKIAAMEVGLDKRLRAVEQQLENLQFQFTEEQIKQIRELTIQAFPHPYPYGW